jgi:hypothetical protein
MQMLSSKDMNFVGYTYKNFEIVNDPELPGIGWISFLASLFLLRSSQKFYGHDFLHNTLFMIFLFMALQLN